MSWCCFFCCGKSDISRYEFCCCCVLGRHYYTDFVTENYQTYDCIYDYPYCICDCIYNCIFCPIKDKSFTPLSLYIGTKVESTNCCWLCGIIEKKREYRREYLIPSFGIGNGIYGDILSFPKDSIFCCCTCILCTYSETTITNYLSIQGSYNKTINRKICSVFGECNNNLKTRYDAPEPSQQNELPQIPQQQIIASAPTPRSITIRPTRIPNRRESFTDNPEKPTIATVHRTSVHSVASATATAVDDPT